MTVKEHVESFLATIGGVLFAAWQGYVGDMLRVAIAAAVSAVAVHLTKLAMDRIGKKFKFFQRFNKDE